MRVLVVTNMYPHPGDPGFGAFVEDQVRSLRKLGVEIEVLFINGRASKLNYLWGAFRVLGRVWRRHYDLVHAHYVFTGILARLQWRYPLVVSFHGAGEMVGWQGTLCRLLAPWVDEVTVTSREHYRQLGCEKAHIVPCGVDLELFRPMPQDEARRALGLPLDKKLVLYAGELRPEKRVDLIQEAVALLRERDPSVELVIATGQPHERIPLYMNAADVLVLASEYEGSPVVIKEALACNLPIVSVDVGDVAERIEGVEGCYLCQRTPQDIADKLELALARGGRTKGRDAVRHLALERVAERMLAVYQKALASRKGK